MNDTHRIEETRRANGTMLDAPCRGRENRGCDRVRPDAAAGELERLMTRRRDADKAHTQGSDENRSV